MLNCKWPHLFDHVGHRRGESGCATEKTAACGQSSDWSPVVQNTFWIGQDQRILICETSNGNYRVSISDVGRYHLGMDGRHICRLDPEAYAVSETLEHIVLVPVLCLALALRDAWCLHASAVERGGRVTAFLGDSGAGKSTLAGYLGLQNHSGWQRIADDVLPVELGKESAVALPHFPQLKLPVNEQVGEDCPQRLPLEAIYVIEASDHAVDVGWHPLDNKTATLALLSHTVAARLFDANLLRRHLSFCVEVAACVPVRRLVYPHRLESLSAVQTLLEQWLQP